MMMQFTEIPIFPPQNPISLHQTASTMINKPTSSSTLPSSMIKPWPGFLTPSKSTLSNNNLAGDANCMEQLLVHCAEAIENNDATPAQQILWVLNNIAPPDGDTNQRLTCAFLRALILRAARTPACKLLNSSNSSCLNNINNLTHKFSLLDLANFVHLTPWYRFGFTAANSIILDAIESHGNLAVLHIVDISVSHCMQIPTLIDSISTRFQGRQIPVVRLTVGCLTSQVPPMFNLVSYEDVGMKLINFARSKGVVLEFKAVPTTPSDGFSSLVEEVRQNQQNHLLYGSELQQEMLIVNCQMTLHYLQHEDDLVMSMRTMFLKAVRSLDPNMVVIVEEDADFTSSNLVGRIKSAFNYLWIPFDTVDTFLPKGSKQREWYEADICWKIENVVAHEGLQRVERQEPKGRWAQRMTEAEFRALGFGEEPVAEVKGMMDEHAAGWGSKKDEDDLVLTWKGHNVVFASAWVPS